MKSKLTKNEKRRRKVLKSLRSTISFQARMIQQKEDRITFLERQLATHASTIISNEVMQLRYSLLESAQGYEIGLRFEAKDQTLYSMTREIVRLPGFRLGYDQVMDALRMRMMRGDAEVADMLARIVREMGMKMAAAIVDNIIKTTPMFRR